MRVGTARVLRLQAAAAEAAAIDASLQQQVLSRMLLQADADLEAKTSMLFRVWSVNYDTAGSSQRASADAHVAIERLKYGGQGFMKVLWGAQKVGCFGNVRLPVNCGFAFEQQVDCV
jgi:hypothetical protein